MQLALLLAITCVCAQATPWFWLTEIEEMEKPLLELLRPIYPGTKWCGDGDRARNYNDVGVFKCTDSCCRDHDSCSDSIVARQSKYGLTNKGPFTKSHCNCDDQFYECLKHVMKEVDSVVAFQIGILYFNVLGGRCYKEEFPVVGCNRTHMSFPERCLEYEVDTTRPKKWQWFDNKIF